jgi:hypothetical protein
MPVPVEKKFTHISIAQKTALHRVPRQNGTDKICKIEVSGLSKVVDKKRGYRVRLNSANHQWGKDPPKEVVG